MRRTLIDDETLAAFIDGRLPSDERESVAAILAGDAAQYRSFTEASQIAMLARGNDTPRADIRLVQTRPRRRFAAIAGAAGIAAGLVAVVMLSRRETPAGTLVIASRISIVAGSGPGAMNRALGAGWDDSGAPITRGDATASSEDAAPARLGALVAARELSGSHADSAAWAHVSMRLASAMGRMAGAAPLAAQITRDDIGSTASREVRARQIRLVSSDTSAFDAGAWIELARLSLLAGRTENLRRDGALRAALPSVIRSLQSGRDVSVWTDAIRALRAIDATRENSTANMARLVREVVTAVPAAGDARTY